MWLADNYRGRNLGSVLYRLGMLAAAARWQLDHCWGLFHDDKANGRYLVLSGYRYMAAGVDWRDGLDRTALNEALVWTPAADIRAIAAEICEVADAGVEHLVASLTERYYTPAIGEVKVA